MNEPEVVAAKCYECGRFVDLNETVVYIVPPYIHDKHNPQAPLEAVVIHPECYKEPNPGLQDPDQAVWDYLDKDDPAHTEALSIQAECREEMEE